MLAGVVNIATPSRLRKSSGHFFKDLFTHLHDIWSCDFGHAETGCRASSFAVRNVSLDFKSRVRKSEQ